MDNIQTTDLFRPNNSVQSESFVSKHSVVEDQQGVRLQTEKEPTEPDDQESENLLDVTPVIRETDVSDL